MRTFQVWLEARQNWLVKSKQEGAEAWKPVPEFVRSNNPDLQIVSG